MKTYNLFLPVYKQGDDLANHLNANNNHPVKSFLDLAEQYKSAAKICELVAGALSKSIDVSDIEIGACTHSIYLATDENVVSSLVKDGILVEEEFQDDDE